MITTIIALSVRRKKIFYPTLKILRRFQVSQDERGWTIRQAISGSYQPSYDRLRWELRGLSGAAAAVAEDGKPVAARQQEGVLRFETGTGFAELRIG